MISKLIAKLQAYPIVIYLQDNPVSVTDIPFPAVTLCPPLNLDIKDFDYKKIATSIKNGSLAVDTLPMDQ